MVTYNVLWDTIFPSVNPIQAAKFARVVNALDADLLNLQEIDFFGDTMTFTAVDVRNLMNAIQPLPNGATWYTFKGQGNDNVIVSKYPLISQLSDTTPSTGRGLASALVSLPNERFATDLYVMNNHYKCCGSVGSVEDVQRQQHSDALVSWMDNARETGGLITLPAGTPMIVAGDLNMVGSLNPLNTLLTGDIADNARFGPDSPPDWDGSSITDAHPLHNGTGTSDYTWRDDFSPYGPGRLDFILYTDSVMSATNKFVLNTVEMSGAQLAATGLQRFDITQDQQGYEYDHLPVVVDFRLPSAQAPGDYNYDGVVNAADYGIWKQAYGTNNGDADGNGDNVVDAADYTVWRDHFLAGGTGGTAVTPAPEPASVLHLVAAGVAWLSRWPLRQPRRRSC